MQVQDEQQTALLNIQWEPEDENCIWFARAMTGADLDIHCTQQEN